MSSQPSIVIHFKEIDVDERVREHIRKRCEHLAEEFPEAIHFELTLQPDANAIECHGHVSGKRTQAAAHAHAAELRPAGDAALDKLERELRKDHDKRIFSPRRKAQKTRGKRSG